jgi:hypothetical protein
MNPNLKKVIAIAASAVLVGLMYYGSFLPLRKSQKLIMTMRSLENVSSAEEFKEVFSEVLDAPSPIGQEELVRHMANLLPPIIERNGRGNPDLVKVLVEYVESYFTPIIDYGKGMSFAQNLYLLGAMNELSFIQTGDPKYLESAHRYFSKGLEIGPRRPQFLYGMFDIYRIQGNVPKAIETAETILSQWPDDERTRNAYNDFLNKAVAATSTPR